MSQNDAIVGDINQLPAGVLYMAPSGLILDVNSELNRWIAPTGILKGQHISDILSGAARIFYLTHIQPALANKGHIEEMFLHLKSKENQLISVVLNAVRTDYCDVFVMLPMAKRQQFEQELMEARKVAEAATAKSKEAYAELAQLQQLLTEKNQELEALASTDSLTGLHNRRYFQNTLERELENFNTNDEPVSLVLIDIDHFKSINDSHGHDMGDQTLISISENLSENMRHCEYLARIGGEEFAVVLPQQSGKQALKFAERLRKVIAAGHYPTGKLTISLGVAEARKNESIQGLYMRADAALYSAKGAGRNRAVLDESTQ
ncbi:hypothetical protein CWE08_03370 [Aliidiomarina iranensis]|uniref:diguanylate cyclase n=1 Tax=Aliidiomarina iranensis TaxID=1434071 RepID=A0A432VZR8_9GAMM|nr:GGDEF domain-containing protein [Aliidiomarina iranensis]RUO22241.1 hypothetical protein CWE08_03370 [Aliidiomarina iranensis]